MSRNQFILLIVIVAVIGGAAWFLRDQRQDSWNNSNNRLGEKVLSDFPLNDVTQLTITAPSGALNLKRSGEQWTVQERGGYPANFTQIREFMTKLWELKVAQPKMVSDAQLNRFDLLKPDQGANAATLIEFKDKDGNVIETLRIGKQHMQEGDDSSPFGGGGYPDGRYVMVGDDVKTVALVKDPLNDVNAEADRWLNKDFIKVDGAKSVAVTAPEATNSWKVTRESRTADWVLADAAAGEAIDKSKVSSLNSVLSSPSFNDVVIGKSDAELGFDKARVVTLSTFDNFTYVVKIGSTNESGNYYVQVSTSAELPTARTPGEDEKPEDKEKLDKEFEEKHTKLKEKLETEKKAENWTYEVSKWTIDALLKKRSDLLAAKKEEDATTEVPMSPLVNPPPKVTSPPVRVPPPEEELIPDPTLPPEVKLPTTVEPPKPVEVPPVPPPAPKPAVPEEEKAPAPEEKPPAPEEKPPATEEKPPATTGGGQ